jgi:hypothetical protein
MSNAVTARLTVSSMLPFVCSVVGGDASESLDHIVVRKEAERTVGSGEFWWGLGAPLGPEVEDKARQNGGTLPALFSKSNDAKASSSEVVIWEEWRSVLNKSRRGRIPDHVVVTSGYNPNPNKRQTSHYALVCHSNTKLTLANVGYCDLTLCQTTKNRASIKYLVGARLLEKQAPLMSARGIASQSVRSIAFEATLVGHCYVRLENPRKLTQGESFSLQQYRSGDDWLKLAKTLRQ